MHELEQAGERTFYINCPAKVGVYRTGERDVYLIDSGADKEAGRKVRQVLDRNGWRLRGILNTHSHADHIGGNHYLQAQTGCKVFGGGIEAAFTRHPVLEPSFLYGGFPPSDLRHKFLLAQESEVTDFKDESFPEEIGIIPLPGHSFDMVGFRTPDETVFLADCVSSPATLQKYAIPFVYDVATYLETLDRVEQLEAAFFVPAHAEPSDDVGPLVRLNREKVLEVAERLLEICREPLNFEEILARVFEGYGLTLNFEQYALVGSTIRSFLSWLKERGDVAAVFQDNRLLWVKAE